MQKIKNLSKNCLIKTKNSLKVAFSQKLTYFYIALFACLFGCMFTEYCIYPIFVLVAIVSVLFNFNESLPFALATFPFGAVLDISGYMCFIFMLAINVGIESVRFLIDVIKKREKIDWWFVGVVLGFVLYLVLPIRQPLESHAGKFFGIYNYACILIFFVMVYLIFKRKESFSGIKVIQIFALSLIISCLFALIGANSDRIASLIPVYSNHGIKKFSGLCGLNPNALAFVCGVTIAILVYMFATSKMNYSAILYILPVLLFGYITLSRQFLFSALFVLGLLIFAWFFKRNKKALYKVLAVVGCFAFIALICFDATKAYTGRFEVKDLVSQSGYYHSTEITKEEITQVADPGRGALIQRYLKDWTSSANVFIFGRGVNSGYINGVASHNSFISILWDTGLIGAVWFVALLFLVVKLFINKNIVKTLKSIFLNIDNYILYVPICALMFVENIFLKPMFIALAAVFIFTLLTKYPSLEEPQKSEETLVSVGDDSKVNIESEESETDKKQITKKSTRKKKIQN